MNKLPPAKPKRRFAFLIHARDAKDFGHLLGQKLGIGGKLGRRLLPEWLARLLWKGLRCCRRVVVCSRFTVSPEVEGLVIGLPMTAEEMLTMPAKRVAAHIVEAVFFAQERLNCTRVGLGAYTAPLSLNGKAVVKDGRITCGVTHGDALSAATAVPAVLRGAARQGLNISEATIAVVGAYGLVGRAAAILLAELQPAGLILTGPNAKKLALVAGEIPAGRTNITFSPDNGAVRAADIVVLCTTARNDVVTPADLKDRAVVVDMAQPPNMGRELCRRRPDVLRIDGGSLATGIDPGFDMGLPPGATLACFTETMLLALAGDPGHRVGPVDIAFARQIMEMALAAGYDLAPLSCFGELL